MKAFLNERMYLDGQDWIPETLEEFNRNIDNLLDILHSFLFLPNVELFYSSVELGKLFNNIDMLDEVTDYSITNPVHKIRQLLLEAESKDWTIQKKQQVDHRYYYIFDSGAQTAYVNDKSFAEACEYKYLGNKVYIINFYSSEFSKNSTILISRANLKPPIITTGHNVDCLTEVKKAIEWFHSNRDQRSYTWNKKHGENGVGVIPNKNEQVSPLECSQDDAKLFLEEAIGYRKSNELYNYDPSNNKFMVWKCDAPGAQSFHAYHPIDQREVDLKVQQFITKTRE
ncbi:Uncharacterised protein [Chryseobacterium gleum]|uniref:Uncharacterized protein n=2 Tax=Chryseobacterium gleum TaxID=250 RepID=A0A448B8X8_CHRGE|nr:hypothetical protein [Chryseobacterium gleum]EFK36169.1 hypothetical protein HMPREF0204_15238 [Chryseobacterium gleum ATCC 35910]QQY31863.1 hypothetical protein I6I60_23965 [Chryseobacterium gleum]VEE10997.1 Uncharacterised protein [Chryseobacterium gleum]